MIKVLLISLIITVIVTQVIVYLQGLELKEARRIADQLEEECHRLQQQYDTLTYWYDDLTTTYDELYEEYETLKGDKADEPASI